MPSIVGPEHNRRWPSRIDSENGNHIILATASGATWDQGDFTYDGSVGFSDLLIQSQNFNGTT